LFGEEKFEIYFNVLRRQCDASSGTINVICRHRWAVPDQIVLHCISTIPARLFAGFCGCSLSRPAFSLI
jgi:hypothetical protein